jgi:hypothetical protein
VTSSEFANDDGIRASPSLDKARRWRALTRNHPCPRELRTGFCPRARRSRTACRVRHRSATEVRWSSLYDTGRVCCRFGRHRLSAVSCVSSGGEGEFANLTGWACRHVGGDAGCRCVQASRRSGSAVWRACARGACRRRFCAAPRTIPRPRSRRLPRRGHRRRQSRLRPAWRGRSGREQRAPSEWTTTVPVGRRPARCHRSSSGTCMTTFGRAAVRR